MIGTYLALFTYVAMGIVTVPLLLLCFWRKWQTIWHAAGVGAITGALPFVAPLIVQLPLAASSTMRAPHQPWTAGLGFDHPRQFSLLIARQHNFRHHTHP